LDPLTHLLTGACIARTGLNRSSTLATAVIVVAAELPDVDILLELAGPVFGFQHHRGFTHTFLGVPLDALVAVLLVFVWQKLRRRWRTSKTQPNPPPTPRWGLLYGYACLGALSHLLLDFTNQYGLRPFMPFSYRWYHWDIVSIIEPVMMLALVGGLALPSLFALINEEIGSRRRQSGRGSAIAALVIIALLWGVRDLQHRRALAALNSLEYRDQLPMRLSAFPYSTNPFAWHGVVETDTFFETLPVDSLIPEVDPHRRAQFFYKPEETPITLAAKRSYLGQVYLDWADYPIVQVTPQPEGEWRVRFIDLRYHYPERQGQDDPLSPTEQLDAQGNVLWVRFNGIVQRTARIVQPR